MTVDFICYDCGQRYRAPRHRGGALFDCRRCGWPTRVPGRLTRELAPTEAMDAADRREVEEWDGQAV